MCLWTLCTPGSDRFRQLGPRRTNSFQPYIREGSPHMTSQAFCKAPVYYRMTQKGRRRYRYYFYSPLDNIEESRQGK